MTSPSPGWYTDNADASLLRWWDGTTWTDRTQPGVQQGTSRPLPGWWPSLAKAVQLSLVVCIAAAAFTFYVDLVTLDFTRDLRESPETVTYGDGLRVDRLQMWSTLQSFTFLVTGALFITWLYTAHRSSRMQRQALKHRSGWAIGGWFVPILALWRPYQMVSDVRAGTTGVRDVGGSLIQMWWWAGLIATSIAASVSSSLYGSAADASDEEYADALARAASWERYDSVITIVAAVLAILVVRQITTLVMDAKPVA